LEMLYFSCLMHGTCRGIIKVTVNYKLEKTVLQYSQRHDVINHYDRRITHLGDLDISFVLLNIFSKFLLHLGCYLLSPKRHIKRCISITKKSDTSITVIYHADLLYCKLKYLCLILLSLFRQ
jgi:hypothetical protein